MANTEVPWNNEIQTIQNADSFKNALKIALDDGKIYPHEATNLIERFENDKNETLSYTYSQVEKLKQALNIDWTDTWVDKTDVLINLKELSIIDQNFISEIKELQDSYRSWYENFENTEECWEWMVKLSDYWINNKSLYYWYWETSTEKLIWYNRLNWVLECEWFVEFTEEEWEKLKFDNFSILTTEEQNILLTNLCESKWIIINWDISENLGKVRKVLMLSYNNQRLRNLDLSPTIEVREEIANKISAANEKLLELWYTLKVITWVRTSHQQKIISENDAFYKWTENSQWFASHIHSPSLSWWSFNIHLFKNEERVRLRVPNFESDKPELQESINDNRVLINVMQEQGFVVNPNKADHYSYWNNMWAYINEQRTGEETTAIYWNNL